MLANTEEGLRQEMKRFATEMGFDACTYALKIVALSMTSQEFLVFGHPKDWVDHYLNRTYCNVDPILRRCQRSTLPLMWNDQDFAERGAREFWKEARSFGVRAGLSFAVHEPPCTFGVFTLARPRGLNLEIQSLATLIGRAQLFASRIHAAVTRLPRIIRQARASLTERERECLRWAAQGKTAWEIAHIIGTTKRTVTFHITNAVRKLGASNKTQAIARAMVLKLIHY